MWPIMLGDGGSRSDRKYKNADVVFVQQEYNAIIWTNGGAGWAGFNSLKRDGVAGAVTIEAIYKVVGLGPGMDHTESYDFHKGEITGYIGQRLAAKHAQYMFLRMKVDAIQGEQGEQGVKGVFQSLSCEASIRRVPTGHSQHIIGR